VKTGSSSILLGNIMLALDGFIREEATFTSIDGKAFGGRSRLGYSSVTKPRNMTFGLDVAEPVSLGLSLDSPLFLAVWRDIGEV
jgi:hypothetical protein